MPEGILIDYNDGRPAMAITAGLRAPSFCTSFSGWSSQFMQYPVNTPLVPGSQAIVVPTNPTVCLALSVVPRTVGYVWHNFFYRSF